MKRVISFVLALVMLIGMMPMMAVEAEAAEDWKAWTQGDSRWGSIKLGNSSCTMAGYGCLVTSVAKLMVQSGYVTTDSFTVKTLITWLNNNNIAPNYSFTSEGGMYWAKPAEMIDGFTYVDYTYGTKNGITGSSTNCEAKLMDLVKKNYHIILAVKGYGHYIAVDNAKSLATGRIYIMDTLSGSQNVDILLVDRYSSISDVALYSGWTKEGMANLGNHIKETYPCYGRIEIGANTSYVKSLPCSERTDPNSTNVESEPAKNGDTYKAIGLVRNTATEVGNLWYKVETENGKTGYIFAGDVESFMQDLGDVSISGVSKPSKIVVTNTFDVKGVISTQYQKLSSVYAWVKPAAGGANETGNQVPVDTNRYDLSSKEIDYNVKFDKLKVGEYIYYIGAFVKSYYAKSATETATIEKETPSGFCETRFSVVSDGTSVPSDVLSAALQLLYYNEGSYGSVNKNDNGAVSLGKIQWHGNRALNLLKTIVNMDTSAAQSILGSTLYNEIKSSTSWESRTVSSTEASAISKLLITENGKKAQDSLAASDVTVYINHGKGLGITDDASLIYFADLENQGGYGMSSRVAKAAADNAGSYGKITLLHIHNAALADSVAGQYAPRRNKTYEYCLGYVGTEGYTLTLKANGGECAVNEVSVKKGNSVGELPNAAHEFMCFEGWYTKPFGGERIAAEFAPTANMTIYAHYSYLSAEVEFDCNGGTIPSAAVSRIVDRVNDGRPGESLVVFTKAGASPGTNIYGSEIAVNEQGKIVAVRKYGEEKQLTVPEGGFILSGQVGWDSDKQESVGGGPDFVWIIVDDMVNPYVSFNAETGEAMAFDSYAAYLAETKRVNSNSVIGELPVPARDGYVFDGWYTASTGGIKITADYKVTCDITLYAHWAGDCVEGHTYQTVVTAPTCTEKGYTTYTCSTCGDQYKGDYIDGPGHNYQTEKIDASCMECGKTVYTCTICAHSYTEYDGDLLTDWSTTKPTGVDESLIESRTEYRTRAKEFTTGTTDTMSGWTLYDSTTQWSDYGEWSDWSDVVINESETTQVEEREAYKYYYYPCPACGVHMHGWGFTCPSDWGGGCGKATLRRDDYVKIWSDISYEDAKLKDFYGTGKYYTTIDGQRVFASSSNPITQYRSRTRTQETVYKFYKWSDWSDWSISEATATDHMEVETRTVYRYVEAELADHKYESTVKEPTCTEKGYTTHTCSVCKDSYTDSETPALGHDYEYSIPVWPTTAVAGKLKDVCKNCQDTVTVTLPQLNEVDYTYKVMKEPTYTAEGTAMYTWKNTEYGNISFSIQLNRLVATLSEIKVASNPNKMAYEIGEELDTTGLTLTAVYTDGSEKSITTGFTVSGFESETAGEKTVTVTYEGKTATFTVEVEAPIVSSAKYVIADAEATAGSTVEVYVEIANNPGIVSLRNKISYDSTALELVEVEDTGMLVGYTTPAATIQSPYILRWADSLATKNNEANGKIVKLTFRIKEDAKEGQYEISVEHVESRNVDGKKITFAKATAKINVIDYVVGDIDGDGEVSDWDAILLNRYLAGWNVQIILKAADIDGDGEVSDWDAIVLERYLAGWDVTLG